MLKRQCGVFVIVWIIMWFGFAMGEASADEVNLILPVYVTHVTYGDPSNYNEGLLRNNAIGIEVASEETTYGIVYANKNSYNRQTVYVFGSVNMYYTHNLRVDAGLILTMGGYPNTTNVVPVVSLQYRFLRFSTTMPLAKTLGAHDVITASLILPMN